MSSIQSLVEEIKKEFVIWYRTTSDVGSEPTTEWWTKKITDLLSKAVTEERNRIISKVEDRIAEFGDQGMKTVTSILEEDFHGKQEVIY